MAKVVSVIFCCFLVVLTQQLAVQLRRANILPRQLSMQSQTNTNTPTPFSTAQQRRISNRI